MIMDSLIGKETCLIPAVIVELAIWEYMEQTKFFDKKTPAECNDFMLALKPILLKRAEQLYIINPTFNQGINRSGERGREYLIYSFKHWTNAIFNNKINPDWYNEDKETFIKINKLITKLKYNEYI